MRIIIILSSLMLLGVISAAVAVLGVVYFYGRDLPDYNQLRNYEPPNMTRLYAADGRLLAEYAIERRVFVPIEAVPKRLRQAFLSAEDRSFYENPGVDVMGIMRAAVNNFTNKGEGGLAGGSTITQQVVKNFLLGNEKTIERKVKEAILAFRISKAFTKDRILELYLNQIYLGRGSYGVAAAALNYFNKPLDELSIEEVALLAAMPKAPGRLDPEKNAERAKERRDWVIGRMLDDGRISQSDAAKAIATDIILKKRSPDEMAKADFFAEEVRRWIAQKYGNDILYKGGLVVRTTLDPKLQEYADNALLFALTEYEKRHGYRGSLATLVTTKGWQEKINEYQNSVPPKWNIAVVLETKQDRAIIGVKDRPNGYIMLEDMKWARKKLPDGGLAGAVDSVNDVLRIGDVIVVEDYNQAINNKEILEKKVSERLAEADKKSKENSKDSPIAKTERYALRQVPQISGGLVALDPHTGRVLAMAGGVNFADTEYNRVTQARRQPGSSFKPFVYLTALENGFSPTSIVMDSPVSLSQGEGKPAWTPANYSNDFLGPTTLRAGLEKSRNAMTVRLALATGIDRIIEISERFGIYEAVPRNFSLVLGAHETTLLKLTNAYGILANGGKKIEPSFIEKVQDRYGKTIYKRDNRDCIGCIESSGITSKMPIASMLQPPEIKDSREQIIDEQIAYQMVSILNGVVERGTATRAKVLERPLAGKTGTTNKSMDTWFIGFSPDLVVGTYIGFDRPKPMGEKETGGGVALPAFIHFMNYALADVPPQPFRVPPGIIMSKVDALTGLPISADTPSNRIILEVFRSNKTTAEPTVDNSDNITSPDLNIEQGSIATDEENQSNSDGEILQENADPATIENQGTMPTETIQKPNDTFRPTVGTGAIY